MTGCDSGGQKRDMSSRSGGASLVMGSQPERPNSPEVRASPEPANCLRTWRQALPKGHVKCNGSRGAFFCTFSQETFGREVPSKQGTLKRVTLQVVPGPLTGQFPQSCFSSSIFALQAVSRLGSSGVKKRGTNPESPAQVVPRERRNRGANSGFRFPRSLVYALCWHLARVQLCRSATAHPKMAAHRGWPQSQGESSPYSQPGTPSHGSCGMRV